MVQKGVHYTEAQCRTRHYVVETEPAGRWAQAPSVAAALIGGAKNKKKNRKCLWSVCVNLFLWPTYDSQNGFAIAHHVSAGWQVLHTFKNYGKLSYILV